MRKTDWKKFRLGDIATILSGGDAPRGHISEFKTKKYCVPIYSNGISERGLYGYTDKATVFDPASTISARGTIGVVYKRTEPYLPIVRLISVIGKKDVIDSDFLFYSLSNTKISGDGSVQAQLTVPMISEYIIRLPDLIVQKRIAHILSCLDAKIELNTQINQNLEAQAQAIFKSWFVDFEPFRDGKFVDSELGPIPEGWRVGMLKDVLTLIKEPTSTTANDLPYLPIDTIPMKSLGISGFRPHEEAQSSLIKFIKNDILIGAMRVYFHRVVLAPCDGITRTTCFVLRSKKEFFREYNLLLCNQDTSIDYAQSTSKGSTMPYAVWDGAFSDLKIIIPPEEILERFSQQTCLMINMIRDAYIEINGLAVLRDTLLPKLMSGEIDVSEIEV